MPRLAPTRAIARLFVALTAALGFCVVSLYAAPAALATVTQTNITAPANRSVFVYNDVTGEPQVTVTGTAPGASNGDEVNIICTWLEDGSAESKVMNATTPPAVVTNQAFSYTGSLEKLEGHTCVLRAVPAGAIPTDLSPFTGPQIAIDELDAGNTTPTDEADAIIGGPNNGYLYNFFFYGADFQGTADFESMSSCSLCDSHAVDPTTSTLGSDLFYDNADLFASSIDGTRSEVQVDGNNSYPSGAAHNLVERTNSTTYDGSEDYEHFPSITFTANVDPLTGNTNLTEEGSFSHCTGGNPAAPHGHLTSAECPNFAATGVGFTRHITQNEDGALVTIRDTFFSTDNQPHELDLLYYEEVHTPESTKLPGYDFTWLPGGFETPGEKASIAIPPGPATILAQAELHQADGDQSLDQGAIELSAPPSEIKYGGPEEFELHYVRTIPAGGSVTISQAFATAFLLGEAETLGQRAMASFKPTVAISSPTAGSTVTSPSVTVSGSVGAGGNGLPATISVNGQTVPVAASGAWSAQVPLVAGANTITATATDAYGLQGSAQIPVTYAPPTSPPPAKARASIVKAFYNGKVLALTIACKAGGANCEGSVSFTAKLKVKVKPHNKHKRHFFLSIKTVKITVTSGSFSIPAGQTKTLLLKLGKTATSIITSTGRLTSTLTLSLRQPNHVITITRSTVLLRNIKSHNKHKGHKH